MKRLYEPGDRKDLLSIHYRAIGPAAIMAALLCVTRSSAGRSGAKRAL
jgi:hypothetical protein